VRICLGQRGAWSGGCNIGVPIMANVKRSIINGTAAIIAILTVIGMLNMDGIIPLAQYANTHLGGYMSAVFFGSLTLTLFLLPIVGGIALEVPMWESNTRIGFAFSNAICNARNGVVSFVALGLLGGIVIGFSSWGIVTILSA